MKTEAETMKKNPKTWKVVRMLNLRMTVISMETDDSVDENDHVFYSQYVSTMGENNQRRTSDTGAGQQHQGNTNLINYAPMAQFPPIT